MRKILAILCTLIALYMIKEVFYIFSTNDIEIVKQRPILIVIALSIIIPLIVLSIWLWRSGKPKAKTLQ